MNSYPKAPAILAAAMALGISPRAASDRLHGEKPGPSIPREERERRKAKKKAAKLSRRRNRK